MFVSYYLPCQSCAQPNPALGIQYSPPPPPPQPASWLLRVLSSCRSGWEWHGHPVHRFLLSAHGMAACECWVLVNLADTRSRCRALRVMVKLLVLCMLELPECREAKMAAVLSASHQQREPSFWGQDCCVRHQAFGEQAGENIFIGTLTGPKWMLALANACVVINLLGQWQVRQCSRRKSGRPYRITLHAPGQCPNCIFP